LERNIVVLSPLARDEYLFDHSDAMAREVATNEYEALANPTWVFYRSGIYGLQELVPGFDPRLSQAVRASANFPFGFPLVELRTDRPLFYSPRKKDRQPGVSKWVRLTDGGAISNSGVWPLFHLLMTNRQEIKRRGILLIVVDASFMPEISAPNRTASLVGTVLDKNPKGEGLHRILLSQLAGEFGAHLRIVQVGLVPEKGFNVLTTWALDKTSLQKIDHSFQQTWKRVSPELTEAWCQLKALEQEGEAKCGSSPADPRGASSRVPLS
jgi:hypothetical protein